MVRDPRDALVSRYYGEIKKIKKSENISTTISEYILSGEDLQKYISFYNCWQTYKDVPEGFLLVRYEDLLENAEQELSRVQEFWGLDIEEKVIKRAVEYASFENMRRMEQEGKYNIITMGTRNPEDPNSYKVRKGKAGTYKEQLSPEIIQFIEKELQKSLTPEYGYNYFTEFKE